MRLLAALSLVTTTLNAWMPAALAADPASRNGRIDASQVESTIAEHRGAFSACYLSGLDAHPGRRGQLEAEVRTRFVVTPAGRVTGAAVLSSTLNDPAVESCLLAALAKLDDFPSPIGGSAEVTYPFVFRPTNLREGGRTAGFKLTRVAPGSVFARIGLRSGDVLLAIDGRALDSGSARSAIRERLKKGGTVLLKLERQGTIREFQFALDSSAR